MTDQLSLYNNALIHVGERTLADLNENNVFRRTLDTVWDSGNIRKEWLAEGLWNFAIRTTEQSYDSAVSPPDFGYAYAFTKPDDWIRTAMVASDEYFDIPLTRYEDEGGYIFADIQFLYFSYVSDDPLYGLDYSKWTEKFKRFCELDLGVRIMRRATGMDRQDRKDLYEMRRKALIDAKSQDAMDEPARFPPQGSWTRSRVISRVGTGAWNARGPGG